jgi:hypothetical protein
MSNLERDRLLSDLELERLMNRSNEPLTRATNDGRVRRKLSAWLKNINNVFIILHNLPEDQLKDVLSEKDIDKLYFVILEAMRIKDYYPHGLEQLRIDFEKEETETFKVRHRAFLQQDIQGISSFSKPLITLIQQGKTWTEEDLLKRLHIDPKDGDAMRITARQLEELEQFGLVKREPNGWKWAERNTTQERNLRQSKA